MTIFIKIPIDANEAAFVEAYYKLVGEIFILLNMLEEKGEDQATGSSVCTEAQAIELKGKYPTMKYYIDVLPKSEWTPKIQLDEE